MTRVEWLDQPTDADMNAIASIVNEFWDEVIPGEPGRPAAELAAPIRHSPSHRRISLGVAIEGGEIVGAVELVFEGLAGREHAGWIRYFVVRRDRRRQGIGRSLAAAFAERARLHGRHRLSHAVAVSHAPGIAFASALGATPELIDVQNRLLVSDLDREMLERWMARATERAAGYSLVAFDGVCPDQLVAPVARIIESMNSAPRSESTEDFQLTPAQLRDDSEAFARQGNVMWVACIRHDASDELVALTELSFGPHRPWLANQGDTVVHPDHRERGLGRWIKAVNALRMLDEHPEVTAVETWNAGVNAPMLSINNAMGFRPIAEWRGYELDVRLG